MFRIFACTFWRPYRVCWAHDRRPISRFCLGKRHLRQPSRLARWFQRKTGKWVFSSDFTVLKTRIPRGGKTHVSIFFQTHVRETQNKALTLIVNLRTLFRFIRKTLKTTLWCAENAENCRKNTDDNFNYCVKFLILSTRRKTCFRKIKINERSNFAFVCCSAQWYLWWWHFIWIVAKTVLAQSWSQFTATTTQWFRLPGMPGARGRLGRCERPTPWFAHVIYDTTGYAACTATYINNRLKLHRNKHPVVRRSSTYDDDNNYIPRVHTTDRP